MSSRAAFGPRLRAHRERRGITLESIAENTKIKLSLLAGLERSDFSQWPRGIFRRAYVREYVVAIGLDPQPLLAEFIHLFPENGPAPDTIEQGSTTPRPAAAMRLGLAVDARDHIGRAASHALAAAAEAGVILAVGGIIAFLAGTGFLPTAGLVALLYYPVAAAWTGRTPQLRQLPTSVRRVSHVVLEQAHAARRTRLYLVPRRGQQAARAIEDPARSDDEFRRQRQSAAS